MIRTTGSWHTVRAKEGLEILCKVKGRFRIKGIRTTNPVAVGDIVDVQYAEGGDVGVIFKIHPRRNYIIRKATNLSRESHIIGANIDQAWLIATLRNPVTFSLFIDRFIVTAEAYQVPARLVFNKWDIYTKEEKEQLENWKYIYEKAGYPCLFTSVISGVGIRELRLAIKDRLNIFSGNSGVGKSSLINELDPAQDRRTDTISEMHRTGKHTTTYPEMLSIKSGGSIIDTPGISGFGTVDINKNELYHFFPEIFKHAAGCLFHNCTHFHEPGCAVQKAVVNGEISQMRYGNYLSMLEEEPGKYRQSPW